MLHIELRLQQHANKQTSNSTGLGGGGGGGAFSVLMDMSSYCILSLLAHKILVFFPSMRLLLEHYYTWHMCRKIVRYSTRIVVATNRPGDGRWMSPLFFFSRKASPPRKAAREGERLRSSSSVRKYVLVEDLIVPFERAKGAAGVCREHGRCYKTILEYSNRFRPKCLLQ